MTPRSPLQVYGAEGVGGGGFWQHLGKPMFSQLARGSLDKCSIIQEVNVSQVRSKPAEEIIK